MTKSNLQRRDFLTIAGAAARRVGPTKDGARKAPPQPSITASRIASWGTIGMIAESEDLFKKAGANVNIFKFDSGKTTRDAMIAGRIDVGVIGATPFVIGAAKGEVEAIATALYGAKTLSIVAGAKSGVNSVKDLKGTKVGSRLARRPTPCSQKQESCRNPGLTRRVPIRVITFQNHVSALASGSIDAFAGVEPLPSVAEVEKLGRC